MSDPPRIAILGAGLAASLVERLLVDRDFATVRFADDADLSAIWTGYGSVYGPATPLPPASAGAVERRDAYSPEFTAARSLRWRRLRDRRGRHHPYFRLGLDRFEVEDLLERALAPLPDGLVVLAADGSVRPGPRGAPAAPDVLARSLAPLEFTTRTTVALVRAPGVAGWNAEGVAAQLRRASGLEVAVHSAAPFHRIEGGHPVRAAKSLVGCDDPESLLRTAVESLADGADCIVFPPVVGRNLEEHAALWRVVERTAEEHGSAVAEFPAVRDPIFGWRLAGALPDAPEGPVRRLSRDGERLRVERDDPEATGGADRKEFDAAVVATGGWFGGGLPREAPFVERRSGLPIWIDGAPVPEDETIYPPDHLGDLPWSDHRLFRAGLVTDRRLRVRRRDGSPVDDVFAAGRILAGFNRFHDGCALGVELVTAVRAAESVAASLEPTDANTTSDGGDSR